MKFIYCFTNLINQKKYVGSSCSDDPKARFRQHMYLMNHPEQPKGQYPLYCALRKYGLENFDYSILEELPDDFSEEQVRDIEQQYCIKFNVLVPNGYNQTLETHHPLNDSLTYQKMKETKRNNAKEVAEVDENNNIINKWRSIIDCAESTGYNEKHIADCCRGERKTTSGKRFFWIDELGNLIIPEYKKNQYKGEKGTTQIQSKSRKVVKIDKNTNEILATYDTLALAARENNCDSSGISKVCKNIRNYCGGYKWRYIDE